MLQLQELLPDAIFQLVNVRWRRIGESLLGLGPNMFIRIELRGVGGEVMQVEPPAATQIQADGFIPMDFGTVPKEYDLAAKVVQQQTEKLDDTFAVNVVSVAPEIQTDPLAGRGDRDRGYNRDSVVPVAMAKDRRLSDWSPGFPDVWGEHEAAFVEEDQMGPALPGVFLYRANRPVSNWQSLPLCARSPDVPVFARSIPSVAGATAGHPSVRNARQSASR